MSASAIANQIVAEAMKIGGETWTKIRQSAPIFIKGYVQSLIDIAKGVVRGQISKTDAKMYVQNARLLLIQGIANTSQIVLAQVQKLVDSVLAILKARINAALPIAIL